MVIKITYRALLSCCYFASSLRSWSEALDPGRTKNYDDVKMPSIPDTPRTPEGSPRDILRTSRNVETFSGRLWDISWRLRAVWEKNTRFSTTPRSLSRHRDFLFCLSKRRFRKHNLVTTTRALTNARGYNSIKLTKLGVFGVDATRPTRLANAKKKRFRARTGTLGVLGIDATCSTRHRLHVPRITLQSSPAQNAVRHAYFAT